MRVRRLRKEVAALEVTAFINLIIVLVPFLLSTAVFTRLAVVDMALPAQSQNKLEQLKGNDLKLEIVIRKDALEVGDRIGGLIQRIENKDKHHDVKALNALMMEIKQRFPETKTATVLPEPDTSYEALVYVMDAVRSGRSANGGTKVVRVDLFPEVSVGDAPLRNGKGGA
jgi:biopolymer transport protein ExbD